MRIQYDRLKSAFHAALLKLDFSDHSASLLANIFAANQRDGVISHGLNRFVRFAKHVKEGRIDINAVPVIVHEAGPIEQWDARSGAGPLNARTGMGRACTLAEKYGIGMVGVRNSNHWMRGGTYGLQAAEAGFIGICWTNAIGSMRPWGGTEPRVGNNPLVIGIPTAGDPILLDIALTQFSMGKLEIHRLENQELQYPGGYDDQGNLTCNPEQILKSGNPLPAGLWKGTGLSIALDLLASIISGGNSTKEINKMGKEALVSQVFVAIKPDHLGNPDDLRNRITELQNYYEETKPADPKNPVSLPGQRMVQKRKDSLEKGVGVNPSQWETLLKMGHKA